MVIRRERIRQVVTDILAKSNITHPPVLVEDIVARFGIRVQRKKNPKSELSGFLYRRGEDIVIGVNSSHPRVRQRFTIAHELGHFLFHGQGISEVHVDRVFEVKFRDDLSSQGVDRDEREANLFAAELLMPVGFLEQDITSVSEIDIVDDEFLIGLARKYRVSHQAMLFRLANLGYISLS